MDRRNPPVAAVFLLAHKLSMRTKRNTTIDIRFRNGLAEGWGFGVRSAFRDALDIKLTARVVKTAPAGGKENIWTRGEPPDYAFGIGDTFHAPVSASGLRWDQALRQLTCSLQIIAVESGLLTVAVTEYRQHQAQPTTLCKLRPDDLVVWLRDGVGPESAPRPAGS